MILVSRINGESRVAFAPVALERFARSWPCFGEVKGLGIIMKTIEPDTADGERTAAVIMRDLFSHLQFEVDDRDYWPVPKKGLDRFLFCARPWHQKRRSK